ncbi:Autoinducer 2 sensor kinase/phosphatase LuxQ [Paramyrothecium foliicola]|nr:Autoinducer 2 sensor kinase/phosphatase LuxQ [Paramyrothecium foliicola]
MKCQGTGEGDADEAFLHLYRYTSMLSSTARLNDSTEPIASSELSTCSDAVLTALCQLGPCQTGTSRALLSLFDTTHQYIVAEAMPFMPLLPSLPSDGCPAPLWLCGTAIPRSFGVCEATVVGDKMDGSSTADLDLPLTLSDDLTTDAQFCTKPYRQMGGKGRFYAAVPLRTRRGINIGVYCVLDERPGRPWTDAYTACLRDVSRTIMRHLESRRLDHLHRRNERMNRGLGSFVEGEATLSGWRFSPYAAAYEQDESIEGVLNSRQQSLGLFPDHGAPRDDASTPCTPNNGESLPRDSYFTMPPPAPKRHDKGHDKDVVFSRAANIIRESVEVEGCVFFRPKLSFRATQNSQTARAGYKAWSGSTSSSSSGGGEARPDPEARNCSVLGFSTSDLSSINSALDSMPGASMAEDFLATLLRRYPQGAVFNFDADGELLSSDSLSGEEDFDSFATVSLKRAELALKPVAPPSSTPPPSGVKQQHRKSRTKRSRGQVAKTLREAFPDARGVVFSPVWDSRKDSWCAGVFAYTNLARRSFTSQGDLSYLRAFCAVVASEIHRVDIVSADQAKADALGAVSHELRSPLHGVLLSAELMHDTNLDVYQKNLAHTIETCSRTLLDTIDHLLDYSQINDFSKRATKTGRTSRSASGSQEEGQFGKKSLFSHVRLDGIVEEVVESVFAGFNFQHKSLNQVQRSSLAGDIAANQRLDTAQALEQLRSPKGGDERILGFGQVSVLLSIDSRCQWAYHVHVGAIRRIIMNLFGNALKYTAAGTITVSLSQETAIIRRRKRHVVKLTVRDTGRGMSTSFIDTGLFRPFSQEDSIAPGTGLGLSLVKKITSQLRGQISVDSHVGMGTTVSVILPLERAELPSEIRASCSNEDQEFDDLLRDLKSLRVRIVTTDHPGDSILSAANLSLHEICRDWLQMEIVSTEGSSGSSPDIVLWSHDASIKLLGTIEELAKYPNVVICPNFTSAFQRNANSASFSGVRLLEFVSQPIGPRKLAKVLLTAYRRWVGSSYNFGPRAVDMSLEATRPRTTGDVIGFSQSDGLATSTTPTDQTGGSLSVQTSTPDSSVGGVADETASSTHCLLVDDNEINIKILVAIMKKLGIDYRVARDGSEVVRIFTENPRLFRCILMDISMPVMDGFEATRLIRAFESQEDLCPVSIFALSGLSSNEAHREALESGMDVFLTKPVKLTSLRELLESKDLISG